MPQLIDGGHIYIAQPPLFRAKRGRTETYIKDERELENFLMHRAVESRTVKLADGSEVFGEALERQLLGMIAYRKLLQVATRRGSPAEIVTALLQMDARDKTFFDHREKLDVLAARMTTPVRTVEVTRDTEHNAFALTVEDRSQGYPRHFEFGVSFVSSGEYRTLAASYRDIQEIKFPVVVRALGAEAEPAAEPAEAAPEEAESPEAPEAQVPKAAKREVDAPLANVDEFVEFFLAAGKKGVAVNRYKGLGEMNPDTLWNTTMNPEGRTLLQVRAEDHAEADQMFTTLMGDQVEPRRKFIEDNALDVRNLDV
jgi:DNA gyrase subunit B